jgi:hypothetical protein
MWHLPVLVKFYYITWRITKDCSFFIFIFITLYLKIDKQVTYKFSVSEIDMLTLFGQ